MRPGQNIRTLFLKPDICKNESGVKPFRGVDKEIICMNYRLLVIIRVSKSEVLLEDFEVLEGWKRCGRPVGFISTFPGTCRSSKRSQEMCKCFISF